jgi:hypothetical protein
MPISSTSFATDEDLAIRVPTDFLALCPADQKLASGTDGIFLASDRWTISSATVNFQQAGIQPGHVVRLFGPESHYSPPGELLAIASVSPASLTLRRKGLEAGYGQPPGPTGGLTGVQFVVVSLAPQIELASSDLSRRFGIEPAVPGRRFDDLSDPSELKEATILGVLARRFLDLTCRPGDPDDPSASKARAYQRELEELLARIVLHWRSAPDFEPSGTTTRFHARVTR